jgi:hypothetical protein
MFVEESCVISWAAVPIQRRNELKCDSKCISTRVSGSRGTLPEPNIPFFFLLSVHVRLRTEKVLRVHILRMEPPHMSPHVTPSSSLYSPFFFSVFLVAEVFYKVLLSVLREQGIHIDSNRENPYGVILFFFFNNVLTIKKCFDTFLDFPKKIDDSNPPSKKNLKLEKKNAFTCGFRTLTAFLLQCLKIS